MESKQEQQKEAWYLTIAILSENGSISGIYSKPIANMIGKLTEQIDDLYNSPEVPQQVVCPKPDNCWGCKFADIPNRLCTLLKEVKNEIGIIHTNDVPKWCPVPSTPEPEQVVCPKCGGDGHWFLPIMGTTKVCTNCNGTGKVPVTPTSEKYYWWCPNCKEEKSSIQVTYGENCTECGGRVESLPVPQTLSEGMLLKEQQIDHEFEKYPMLKKCGVTLYCCIMDILRLQLAKAKPLIEVLTASKYEAEIDELKGEIVNLNTQLTNEHSHYMADLEDKEARIKELESRNRSLEKDLDQLNDEYAAQHIVTSRRIQSEAREQERKEIGEYLGQRFRRYEHNDGNGIERMEFTLHRDFVDSLKRGVKP